ncbi:MAG: ferredoxin [Solidesulfovibrio sp.]
MNTPLFSYSVNPACCNGCGACAAMAPDLFAMDPISEKPVLLCAEAPREAIEQVMAFCPHDCIEMD